MKLRKKRDKDGVDYPVPVVDGELIGFKVWDAIGPDAHGKEGLIPPVYSSHAWEAGRATKARCEYSGKEGIPVHDSPDPLCDCGLYMYSNPKGLQYDGNFIGVIKAWGKVLVHLDGIFRAEYAQVVALMPTHQWSNKDDKEQVLGFCNRFEIDLLDRPEFLDMVSNSIFDYGRSVGKLLDPTFVDIAKSQTQIDIQNNYMPPSYTHVAGSRASRMWAHAGKPPPAATLSQKRIDALYKGLQKRNSTLSGGLNRTYNTSHSGDVRKQSFLLYKAYRNYKGKP